MIVLTRLKSHSKRLVCQLISCSAGDFPECHRCGAEIYGTFIDPGLLEPLFRIYWRIRGAIRKLGLRNCDECGKRFKRGYNEYLCSEECHEHWLPF